MPKIDPETKPITAETNGKPQAKKADHKNLKKDMEVIAGKKPEKSKPHNSNLSAQPPEPKQPKPKKKKFTIPKANKEIKYAQKTCISHVGDKALTVERAKEILGWKEEGDNETFEEYHFMDWNGKKIICTNNLGNRPFDQQLARTYMSDILQHRWFFNGETIILTACALVASGQHRLIGFIWAVQEWEKNKERWPLWEEEPTLECLLAVGIEDRDEVINTVDSGKSRSLADTIYRTGAFSTLTETGKRNCSKMLENAIKWLYYRTGTAPESLAPGKTTKRTHSESHSFLERHNKLIACVKHIYEEDAGEGRIKKYCPLGYASAYLYMMGCSGSEPKEYHESEAPNEDMLNWDNYDTALQFWSDLAGGDKKLGGMRQALGELIKENLINVWTQSALVCKAWPHYLNDESVTPKTLEITWNIDEETQARKIGECPTLGGIDVGSPEDKTPEPTQAEIERAKQAIKLQNQNGKLTKVAVDIKPGEKVKVQYGGSSAWVGTLVKIEKGTAFVKDEEDTEFEVPADCISKSVAVEVKPTVKKPAGKTIANNKK